MKAKKFLTILTIFPEKILVLPILSVYHLLWVTYNEENSRCFRKNKIGSITAPSNHRGEEGSKRDNKNRKINQRKFKEQLIRTPATI